MRCAYCHEERGDKGSCPHCGAPVSATPVDHAERMDPFYLNGYIVWPLRNLTRDIIEYQFYLGERLVETLVLDVTLLRELVISRYGEGCATDDLLWGLFLTAHGDLDAMEWRELNVRRPATLRITREEDPRTLRAKELGSALTLDRRAALEALHG